jgi:hypothetical protein
VTLFSINSVLLDENVGRYLEATNQKVESSSPSGRTTYFWSNPDTWVTERTDYMGNTFGPNGFSSGSSTRVSRSKYRKS